MKFRYKGLDESGKTVAGVVVAASEQQVSEQVESRGIYIYELTRERESRFFTRKVSYTDLLLFSEQISLLLGASLKIDRALESLDVDVFSKPFGDFILYASRSIKEGMSLSESCESYNLIFPEFFVASLRASEESSGLEEVLTRLSVFLREEIESRKSRISAITYPLVVFILSILAVSALLLFVVPEMVVVLTSSGRELPELTQIILLVSDYLSNNYAFILLGMLIVYLIVSILSKVSERFAYLLSFIIMRVPLLGGFRVSTDISLFSMTSGMLIKSGVNVFDAFEIATRSISLHPIRHMMLSATKSITEGSTIKSEISKFSFLSKTYKSMIAVGEESGALGDMLLHAGDQQRKQSLHLASRLSSLIEPISIVLVGTFVLLIILGIIVPIFDMNQLDIPM